MKPLLAATATEVDDDQLVVAVREGSEEAFEALYRRYRPRILGYVRSMCQDHARAEDVTQEAFMSALRGLQASDKEIAFRPWMYEIAKNACIDHLRRAGRSAEVSIDSDDFSPHEEGRISQSQSGTDAEVARREDLDVLQMAFGDLPRSQHRILVMRELEGLSYDRIGSRMGLSRGAVESLLFRARRTLREGFDDIGTGERCQRMLLVMESVADARRTGVRDRRRLHTHLRDCPACRRAAVTLGLDELALAAARERGSALRRVAALLPLPAFLRRRAEDGASLVNSFGPAAEQATSLGTKATAVVVAAALAAGGAGVATKASGGSLGLPDLAVPGISGGKEPSAGSKDRARPGRQSGGEPAGRDGASQGGAAPPGQRTGSGAPGGQDGGRGSGATGRDDPARSTTGALGEAVNGTVGTVGSVGSSPGGTTNRVGETVDRVGGTADQVGGQAVDLVNGTLQDATGGNAPRLPKPSLPLPGSGSGDSGSGTGTGGGSRTPLPDVGDTVKDTTSTLPVPKVQVPKTEVTLPGTNLRLP